jgi:hypothetical protein
MPNTTIDRDKAVRSAARFLIFVPAFPLRAVLAVADGSLSSVWVVLALYRLCRNKRPTFDPEPNWEDDDCSHLSRMQRFVKEVFYPGFVAVVSGRGINRKGIT